MEPAGSEFPDLGSWNEHLQRSPQSALSAALDAVGHSASPDARAVCFHVIARARFELGQINEALDSVRQALELEPTVVDRGIRLTVALTSGAVLAESGNIAEALEVLDRLVDDTDGSDRGRALLQQAYVLQHAGRLDDALGALDRSDRLLTVDGTPRERFSVHVNRGLVLVQMGRLEAAEEDFEVAARLAKRLNMTAAEGQCLANLAVTRARSRRLVDALRLFDEAGRLLDSVGRPDRITTWMEVDRAETMMHSGMLHEAVAAAHRARDAAMPSGNAMLIGDALLMCARTELRLGRLRQAANTATVARERFAASGRADMVAHAEALIAQIGLHGGGGAIDAAVADLVAELHRSGWHQQADELTVERIRAAWRTDDWSAVTEDIATLRLHAFGERRDLALIGWFAEALARSLDGDTSGAVDACRSGLGVLDHITAEATDLETRSGAMRLGADLSRWLIEIATQSDDPDLALAASEGTRARALHDELDDRRQHRPLTEDGAVNLRAELRARLHGRCLVQWLVVGDRVHAVVSDEEGNRLVDVAELRAVVRERDRLTVWLDRAAAEPDGSSARAARAGSLLDELLLGPLGLPDHASIVIVPVDELHGVPWSGLPSIAHRPVVLSPSCRLWLDADRRSSTPIETAGFIAGPKLSEDDAERLSLRRSYGRVDEASGEGATAATVRSMFGAHDVVHVAAHGRFSAERPLLSTFALADGEVTLHEAIPERVRARLAVVSSCEGGAHQGSGGSEVLGLAAVLLARGAVSVLAPLTVVRELECGEFVAAVHDEMASGVRFGLAVANVRARWLGDDDVSRWAVASSFSCFGSGATSRRLPA